MSRLLLRKAHVRAYERRGPQGQPVPVREHDDRRPPAQPKRPGLRVTTRQVQEAAPVAAPAPTSWWDKTGAWLSRYFTTKAAASTTKATAPARTTSRPGPADDPDEPAWLPPQWTRPKPPPRPPIPPSDDPAQQVLTFEPGKPGPKALNGIPFTPFEEPVDWAAHTEGTTPLDEPPFPLEAVDGPTSPAVSGPDVPLKPAAGAVILEPDGRVWLAAPTGGYGGSSHVIPKGRVEPGLSTQQTAIKEAWEETGLQIEILGFLGDYRRTTTVTRYYLARRIGGEPWNPGWESERVVLTPRQHLTTHFLDSPADHEIARDLEAKLRTATFLGGGDWRKGLAQLQAPSYGPSFG